MSCGVDCRLGSNLVLLWPWRRPAATAPIGPLAWEPSHAAGVALEKAKRQKKKKRERERDFPYSRLPSPCPHFLKLFFFFFFLKFY